MEDENVPSSQFFPFELENNDVEAENDNDDPKHDDKEIKRLQVGGAALVGGIAGFLVGGPLGGMMAAGGAAALATTKGKAGEVARATGNVAVIAGDRIQQTSSDCQRAGKGIRKFEEKHKLTEKTLKSLKSAEKGLKKFDEKHKVTDRATNGVNKWWDWVARQLALKKDEDKNNKEDANAVKGADTAENRKTTESSSTIEDETMLDMNTSDEKHSATDGSSLGINRRWDWLANQLAFEDQNTQTDQNIQESTNIQENKEIQEAIKPQEEEDSQDSKVDPINENIQEIKQMRKAVCSQEERDIQNFEGIQEENTVLVKNVEENHNRERYDGNTVRDEEGNFNTMNDKTIWGSPMGDDHEMDGSKTNNSKNAMEDENYLHGEYVMVPKVAAICF